MKRLAVASIALFVAGCASGPYYWTKPGATRELFMADHTECARGATIGYGVGSEQAYKACMRQKEWTRIQGRGSQPPAVPHFRGIEGDDEFGAAPPETPLTDLKALTGTWEGWVTTSLGKIRGHLVIKDDGSFEAFAGGTSSSGVLYLETGKVRYRSSRTNGAATLSVGKTVLTLTPEGNSSVFTSAQFERAQ